MRWYRKVIRIRAEDSPNVKLALAQIKAGLKPTGETILPGVLPYDDYVKRRALWDEVRQCVSLDGMFWQGASALLFPPHWLNQAEKRAEIRTPCQMERWMGIDPAEGGDSSCWAIGDVLGLLDLISLKTPDTTVVPSTTRALMREWNIPPENVMFDRGGGGKQYMDMMRKSGLNVRSVGFGEGVLLQPKRGIRLFQERMIHVEEAYAYVRRRDQMYGESRLLLDPGFNPAGYAIPAKFYELRRQMSKIPLTHDPEGRLKLLPKNKPNAKPNETLIGIIGNSPDELDSYVVMNHCMLHEVQPMRAGVA